MFFIEIENVVSRYAETVPYIRALFVSRSVFVALEYRDADLIDVYTENLRQKVKAERYRLLFEIVAERPVAEHFEKRAMRSVAHLVYIARTHAFLNVRKSSSFGMLLSEKIRYERMHSRSREKNRRIVLRYKRARRYHRVSPLLKKFDVLFS